MDQCAETHRLSTTGLEACHTELPNFGSASGVSLFNLNIRAYFKTFPCSPNVLVQNHCFRSLSITVQQSTILSFEECSLSRSDVLESPYLLDFLSKTSRKQCN